MDSSALTKLGLGVLAFDSALAVHNSWGDAASVAFALAADAALALLLCLLRKLERADRPQYSALATVAVAAMLCTTALDAYSARRDAAAAAVVFLSYAILLALTGVFLAVFARRSQSESRARPAQSHHHRNGLLLKVGLGALALNSALTVYNSWGDVASVAFVLAADAALALLFLRRQLRDQFDSAREEDEEDGVGRINKGAALATWAVAALLCTTALETYSARRDAASAALVLLLYAVFSALTGVFLAGFARARGDQQGRAGAGSLAVLEQDLKAMFASGVAALMPPAVVAAAAWAVAAATVTGGF